MRRFEVVYFATGAWRSPVVDFLDGLPPRDAAAIVADIQAFGLYGEKAPISTKSVTGSRGLWEIRTRGFRTLYAVRGGRMVVLHVCRKQDQRRGIGLAAERLKRLQEG